MTHHVHSFFLSYLTDRRNWLHMSAQIATRLMGDRSAIDTLKAELVYNALVKGQLLLETADISGTPGDALQALMSNGGFSLHDIAERDRQGHAEFGDEFQALALELTRQGCDPQRPWPKGMDQSKVATGTDAIDMALMTGADRLVREWAPRVDWEARRMDGLAWVAVAARAGLTGMVTTLLEIGGDPNYADEKGNTALFHSGDAETVQCLLQRGADPALLNHDGVDAVAYWRGTRGLRGERFEAMKKSMGPVAAPDSEHGRMRTFLETAKSAPTGVLLKEARRLKLTGGERVDGRGLVSSASERMAGQDKYSGGAWNTARTWLNKVAQWPEAMEAATNEELAALRLVGRLYDPDTSKLAKLAMTARGLSEDDQISLLEKAFSNPVLMKHKKDNTEVLLLMSEHPGFLGRIGETFLAVAKTHNGDYYKEDELLPLAKRLAHETQGWDRPELLARILRFGVGASEVTGNTHAGRFEIMNVVARAIVNGAPWDNECAELMTARAGDIGGRRASEFAGVRAALEAARLERDVGPAPNTQRNSPRL